MTEGHRDAFWVEGTACATTGMGLLKDAVWLECWAALGRTIDVKHLTGSIFIFLSRKLNSVPICPVDKEVIKSQEVRDLVWMMERKPVSWAKLMFRLEQESGEGTTFLESMFLSVGSGQTLLLPLFEGGLCGFYWSNPNPRSLLPSLYPFPTLAPATLTFWKKWSILFPGIHLLIWLTVKTSSYYYV